MLATLQSVTGLGLDNWGDNGKDQLANTSSDSASAKRGMACYPPIKLEPSSSSRYQEQPRIDRALTRESSLVVHSVESREGLISTVCWSITTPWAGVNSSDNSLSQYQLMFSEW